MPVPLLQRVPMSPSLMFDGGSPSALDEAVTTQGSRGSASSALSTVNGCALLVWPATVTVTGAEPALLPSGAAVVMVVSLHAKTGAGTPPNATVELPWLAPK